MLGRTNTGGGGGLNFKVVGGTVAPSNPKENDIWINTDHKITEWIVDAVNPFESSEEIFTSDGSIIGYYLDQYGTEILSDVNLWICTKKLSLPNGAKNVTITAGSTATTSVCHCFYDEDGNFISSVKRSTGKQVYDVPNGARSIRVSIRSGDTLSVMVKYIFANDGAVWICTGVSGIMKFDALKKNCIQVYPISAIQYVNGALVDVTAQSYQYGEWVSWIKYLYSDGSLKNELVDGFKHLKSTMNLTYNSNNFTLIDGGSTDILGGSASVNIIDVTGCQRLLIRARLTFNTSAPEKYKVGLSKTQSVNNFTTSSRIPYSSSMQEIEVPIPVDGGKFYLVFTTGASSQSGQYIMVEEIRFE